MAKRNQKRVGSLKLERYVLDTNSLIYALNEQSKIPLNDYFVSVITEIELLSYAKLSVNDELIIKEMLSRFKMIELNESVKEKTIDIRKKYKLKLPDSIIVATAIDNNAVWITSDRQLMKLGIVDSLELKEITL